MKRIIALCALLACLPAEAQQVYRWVDGNGRVQYSDKPPPGVKAAAVQSRISSYSGTPTVTGMPSAGAKGMETRPAIKMYVTEWCTYCKQARAYLSRQGIRHTELDVEKSAAARDEYQRLQGRGVPVILVGTQRMNGYSEDRLAQMLKAAGY
jgi:glutaredoxin